MTNASFSTPSLFREQMRTTVLNLDALGYGPGGNLNRKDWQQECKKYLDLGKEAFKAWQETWIDSEKDIEVKANFGFNLRYLKNPSKAYDNNQIFYRSTLDFVGLKFDNLAVFNFEFLTDVLFGGCYFQGTAGFKDVKFRKSANFDGSVFNGAAWFSEAIFDGDAWFLDIVVDEAAYFDFAEFNADVWFGNSTFRDLATFTKATYIGRAGYNGVSFLNESNFSHAIFKSAAFFNTVSFSNIGFFKGATFKNTIPDFLGVDNAKTLLVFSGDEYFNKNDTQGDATDRIAQLKRLAEEQGQNDQMLMFNAFELNAKAKQSDASSLFKVFTWLYEIVSNYGRSFGRPLFTYLGLIFITYLLALFAAANNSPQDCKGELWRVFSDMRDNGWPSCLSAELPDDKLKLNGYRAAFEYTTYRAAGVLDFSDNDKQTVAVSKRLFNADIEPTWMRFWGIFKAIASAALLFLAALGLRNKYRIK